MLKRDVLLKTPDDIKRIRDSGRIISDIFRKIEEIDLKGISTWDIDSIIGDYITACKGRAAFKTVRGYGFASCISINNEVVHGIPSKKKIISSGDLVKIDSGAVLRGYFCDSCKTFSVGQISETAKEIKNAAKAALNTAINMAVPGCKIGDLGHSIQNFVQSLGFSVVEKYTGHGVGFSLHEPPVVPHYGKKGTGIELREGFVIAIEPIVNEGTSKVRILDDGWTAVTADGKLSAQFEHTVAVTEKGPLVLTE